MARFYFLLAVAIAALISSPVTAQLKPGALAPDWTYKDINNQTHHLYDYLDSGYVVVIDVSATWCSPCWGFHNTHIGKTLTDKYGPTGSVDPKRIKYFFFEADANTTLADLQGNTSATQGNWIANTNYPIIDDIGIKKPYYVTGYPTFFVICPNKRIAHSSVGTVTGMTTEAFYTAFFNSCPKPTTGNDAALIAPDSTVDLCHNSVLLQNMSSQPLTSANIKVYDGATLVTTQAWTGNLAAFGITGVTLTAKAGVTGQGNLKFKVEVPSDVNAANDELTTAYSIATLSGDKIRIEVKTDRIPSETWWRLLNAGQLVAETKYNQATDQNTTFTYNYTVGQGACLHFELFDTYGNGINGGTTFITNDDGEVKIYDGTSNALLATIGGTSFKYQTAQHYRTAGTPVGVPNVISGNTLDVYPNPAVSVVKLKLQLSTQQTANITLNDMTGRTLYRAKAETNQQGTGNVDIPVADFAPGLYILTVKTNDEVLSRQMSIVR